MTFVLISAYAKRDAHTGLNVEAYYQQKECDFALAKPFKLTVYNGWPKVEIEADVITHHFDKPMAWIDKNGNFERTKDGSLKITKTICLFCPKVKSGAYAMGRSPQEQLAGWITKKLVPCEYALSDEMMETLNEEWNEVRQ